MRPALSACLIAHNDIIAVHLMELGSEAQKQEWPPRMATGEVTAEIGMSEPGAGSDLKGIRTMARSDGGGGETASCLRARNRSLPMATTPT